MKAVAAAVVVVAGATVVAAEVAAVNAQLRARASVSTPKANRPAPTTVLAWQRQEQRRTRQEWSSGPTAQRALQSVVNAAAGVNAAAASAVTTPNVAI